MNPFIRSFLVFIIIALTAKCEAQTWSKRYDVIPGENFDLVRNIEPTSTGYIITRYGGLEDESLGTTFFTINQLGEVQSIITYTNENGSFGAGFRDAGEYIEGLGYIQAGALVFAESSRALLIGFTETGDTLFTRSYGDTTTHYSGTKAIHTIDGGYALLVNSSEEEYTITKLVKFSDTGSFEWDQSYEYVYNGDLDPRSLAQFDNGDFIIGCGVDPDGNDPFRSHRLILTDSGGNEIWQVTYGSPLVEENPFVSVLSDNEILVVGDMCGSTYPSDGYNYIAKRSKEDGTLIWERTYPQFPSGNRVLSKGIELADGSIVACGASELIPSDLTYRIPHGTIHRVNSLGVPIWSRRYLWDNGLNTSGYFTDMTLDPDGGYVCAGQVADNVDFETDDIWIMKLDSDGCLVPDCVVGVIEHEAQLGFNTYPNPASDVLSVYVETNLNMKGHFSLTDLNGRIVFQGSTVLLSPEMPTTYMYQVAHLARGMYVLSFESEEGAVLSKKVLLQ